MNNYTEIDNDSKESGMKFSNTKAYTTRLLVGLAIIAASFAGLSGIAEAATCFTCHAPKASTTDIRPVETAPFRNITTGSIKGSHAKHIPAATTDANKCVSCHGTASGSYTTKHRDGFINVTTASGAPSLTYSKGAKFAQAGTSAATTLGTCSTAYCHSSGQATPTYVATPEWGGATSLNCAGCHGTEGGSVAGEPRYANGAQVAVVENNDNSHAAHVANATDCAKCHADTVDAAGTAIKAGSVLHTNAARNVNFAATYDTNAGTNSDNYTVATKTCASISCHGAGTPKWGGAALLCNQCHTANNTLAGKHAKHYGVATVALSADKTPSNTSAGTTYEYSCGVCHNGVSHADGTTQVVFDSTYAGGGTYTAGVSQGTDNGITWTNGTCATTYCHGNGNGAVGNNTTFTWATAQTVDCKGCHSFTAASGTAITTGKHTAHINDGTIMPNITCSACHVSTTSDNTTIANTANHVNKVKDVTILGTYDSDVTPSNNYSAGSCNNVYCHSDGQATPGYKSVAWTATIADCKSCHNYNLASGTVMATGSHTEHVNNAAVIGTNYGCQDCHSTTTSNGTSITTPANHIDKVRNVSMAKQGGGTETSANCTTTYCHSTGQATPASVNPPAWGNTTDLTCKGCHGAEAGGVAGAPWYTNGVQAAVVENNDNSHASHVTSATDCARCHAATVTTAGTAILGGSVLHTNQTRDVNIGSSFDTNGATSNYNSGSKTCSAISCHGAGTPMWGGATLACDQCHLANNTLAGKHSEHYGVATLAVTADKTASNTASATAYEFSCGVCHNSTPHADGNVGVNQAAQVVFDATIAGGGTYTAGTLAGTDTGTRPWTAGTCSATYCHSDGNGGGPKKTAFNWNSANNTLRCYGCHGSQDIKTGATQASMTNYSAIRTNAHARHVRPDINTELGYGNGIDCNKCHVVTVTAAMNSYSTVGVNVLKKDRHVNKLKNYSGVTSNPNGGTALSNGTYSAGNCSSNYCHSNSKVGTGLAQYANPASWSSNTVNQKCNYCHGRQTVKKDTDPTFGTYSSTGVPNYLTGFTQGSYSANSHKQHLVAGGMGSLANPRDTLVCYNCHSATLASNTSAAAARFRPYSSRHAGGSYNVKLKAAIGGTYNAAIGTKNCSSTLCHGGTSPKWGANTSNNTCTKCHGTGYVGTIDDTNGLIYKMAPPKSTSGATGSLTGTGQVSNDPKVGAHQTHLLLSNGFSNYSTQQFRCENCHGTMPTNTAHITGSSKPDTTFQKLANNRGTMSPAFNSTNLTCSNTYCHNPAASSVLKNAVNTGSNVFPSWTSAKYLGDTRKTQANCGVCHKSPGDAGFEPAATHNLMTIAATNCIGCHEHEGDNQGSLGRRHMDGKLYGGGNCDSCHGYQETSWSAATQRATEGKGAHAKHVAYLVSRWGGTLTPASDSFGSGASWTNVCGVCHNGAPSSHTMDEAIGGTGRNISISTAYQFGGSAPTYNGVIGASSSTNSKTCSNVSCHYFKSPVWSTY